MISVAKKITPITKNVTPRYKNKFIMFLLKELKSKNVNLVDHIINIILTVICNS